VPTREERFDVLQTELQRAIDTIAQDTEHLKTPLELFEEALTNSKTGEVSAWLSSFHIDALISAWATQQELTTFGKIIQNGRERGQSVIEIAERLVAYQKRLADEVLKSRPSHSTSQVSNVMEEALVRAKQELAGHGLFRFSKLAWLVKDWHKLAAQAA
jgi:hypothetical protein